MSAEFCVERGPTPVSVKGLIWIPVRISTVPTGIYRCFPHFPLSRMSGESKIIHRQCLPESFTSLFTLLFDASLNNPQKGRGIYGIHFWGCTRQSNMDVIKRLQSKVPRSMVNAPWYIRNNVLHRDRQVDRDMYRIYYIHTLCNKFYTYLYHHIAVLDRYIHSNLV